MFDKNDQDISQIIDTGLEAILSGKATLDQFLAQYPEQAGALRPELETAVWLVTHREELAPRPGFIRSSRKRVIARIKEEASTSGAKRSIFGFIWPQKIAYQWAAALMVLILFFSGTSGLVSASQGSLPGDDLYGIKIASEEIAYNLTFGDVNRVELSASYTQRRLDEVLALMERGDQDQVELALQAFERQVNHTIALLQAVKNVSPGEKRTLAVSIYQDFAEQAGRLSSLHMAVAKDLRNEIEAAERLMIFGATKAADEANNIFDPTATPIVVFTLTPSPTNTLAPSSTPIPSTPVPSSTPIPVNTLAPTSTTDQTTFDQPVTPDSDISPATPDNPVVTKTPKPTNVNRPAKPDTGKPEEKPDKPDKPDKPENPSDKDK